jgi:hypothetical protein
MTIALRHSCRHCRTKLTEPSENLRRAFCARGCYRSFYRSRCVVCEETFRRKTEWQKTCIRKTCKAELRRFPLAYSWREKPKSAHTLQNDGRPPRSAHSTGIKFGLEGDRPKSNALREWWWGDPGTGDLSLYDEDGLTIARVVQGDGRYQLCSPVTWPRQTWADLESARDDADPFALVSLSLDPALAKRIVKDNSTRHPMGPPLNRSLSRQEAIHSDWQPVGDGTGMPDIPASLLRKVG